MAQDDPLRLCEQLDFAESLRKVWIEGPTTWWTSGIYSLGIGLRKMLAIGRRTPLNLMSDHGVTFGMNDFLLEVARQRRVPNLYLTWFEGQVDWSASQGEVSDLDVIGCPHPYPFLRVGMRDRFGLGDGCLGFIPHGLGSEELNRVASEQLLLDWSSLPKSIAPRAVCLSHHEMSQDTVDLFVSKGLPVVSAGNPNSPWFAYRFYKIISQFKTLTSPVFGSQLCLGTEAGLTCFMFGRWPESDVMKSEALLSNFRRQTGVEWQDDTSLWLEAVDVFSDSKLQHSKRSLLSSYLLGEQFADSLGAIRQSVLEAAKPSFGSWLRAGQHLGRSVAGSQSP